VFKHYEWFRIILIEQNENPSAMVDAWLAVRRGKVREMIVLVTGATAGFGEAIARRFAKDGAKIVAAGRRGERLNKLAQELGADKVHPLILDVRDRAAVERAVSGLPAGFAEIDVLVNNAGLAQGLEPAQRADLDDWDRMVDTNVKGLVYLTRNVLPGMVARGRGHVVNISSIAGSWPYPGGNVYGSTKAFVQQFSRNLRADLLGTPVRVTDIAPGMVAGTEFSQVRFHGDEARAQKGYEGAVPLNADDIADAVHWAASQPARVNINAIEIMPVCQAWSAMSVYRTK
jgi:3-hydroxy acid dehydrogenase/malonic semialdehyde reductase